MNENLNLVEILKDCPKGTKLYSPLVGEVEFDGINYGCKYPIVVQYGCADYTLNFTKSGLLYAIAVNGECMLFPSKEVRTWDNFAPKKPKFDPKTLNPFDKVLVKCLNNSEWLCNIFSHIEPHSNFCFCANDTAYKIYIPYNDDTKHLVGTTEEAPEYYRYWEE